MDQDSQVKKSAGAFRTISEVAVELDLPQHVLRFWETKFTQIKPMKRGGGRRYYRPEDVRLLRQIRDCLYKDGYTIRGVQKLLRDGGPPDGSGEAEAPRADAAAESAVPVAPTQPGVDVEALRQVLNELRELRGQLA
ncbi:MAG: MerR family transcriptional regulator [Rhodospirillaceae bacterium]